MISIRGADELRGVKRARVLKAFKNIEKVVEELEKTPIQVPKGFSATLIREDRDRDSS